MPLPPLAPFPPSSVRRSIPPAEWESCLDAWMTLAGAYLHLSQPDFAQAAADDGHLIAFLTSYFQETAKATGSDSQFQSKKAHELKKQCFLLSHRLLSAEKVPQKLLDWTFLSHLSHVFLRSERLRELLSCLWRTNGDQIEASLQKLKSSLTKTLESSTPAAAEESLKDLVPLLHTSPEVATLFIAGTDFLDSLCASYIKSSPEFRAKIVTVASLALLSLTRGKKPSYSLLSDTLYSLKSNAETVAESSLQPSLLSDLVTNTPLIARIRDSGSGDEGVRVKNFAETLSSFRQPSLARPKQIARRKADKGKGRAVDDEFGHAAGSVNVHQMSLVTQIQDLFPDLGSAFIIKCLREYDDDVEQVTAHLLDDSLPPHLKSADRAAQLPPTIQDKTDHHHSALEPRSTPVTERRNVYDNDELDQLTVDTSRLHIGRKNESLTADKILADKKAAPNKAAILSALATFDLDDDERDDTYDVEDVGGTVDSAVPGNDEAAELRDKNEEALFRAYSLSKDTFNRDAATRRGKAREALKSETGMTDEAIEGWSIMLARDPRNLRRLEAKFSTFDGQQREIASTRWRDSPAGSGTEDSEGQGGRGGFRGRGGRGRGRGRGGRGGGQADASSAAGPANDKQTQVNRHRKEANKSSRANHNRRDQRARKMARGGGLAG